MTERDTFHDLKERQWEVDSLDTMGIHGIRFAPPQANDNVHFSAITLPRFPETIQFSIRTMDDDGNRHPSFVGDYRAHILATRALRHLEVFTPINNFHFEWNELSDNLDVYRTERARLLAGGDRLEIVQEMAVAATWAGTMIAKRNGFTILDRDMLQEKWGGVDLNGVKGRLMRPSNFKML